MEIISLSIPWVFTLVLTIAFALLVKKKWKISIVLLLIVLCANCYFKCIPFYFGQHNIEKGQAFCIMSFNCNMPLNQGDFSQKRREIANLLMDISPDIVFLTENYFVKEDSLWLLLSDKYVYRSQQNSSVGNTLYSKYPISDSTIFNDIRTNHCTISQIDFNGEQVVIYGVHLISNNYNDRMDYMSPDSINNHHEVREYLKNIMTAGYLRQEEAQLILSGKEVTEGILPTIVMGDFNDVCGSPALNILETAGLKDAWWEGGFGYGATIHRPLPFRIDHILYSDKLKLRSIKKVDANGLSDHDALVATFSIK